MAGKPSVVTDALARAAERAQRLAELDSAQNTMEKLLNYPLPSEQLPWGEPLSMSQLQCNHPMPIYDYTT